MKRIKGLDSIRFVCAFMVLIGHLGLPLPYFMDGELGTNVMLVNLGKLIGLIFNGPAAVICFFIISGFCINFPFIGEKSIPIFSYYSRRLLRIGIPAIIALACYVFFIEDFLKLARGQLGVLWSVICEIIYYLIFPILFYFRKSLKWSYMFVITYVLSLLILFFNFSILETNHDYPSLSFTLTWLIGLPCWILGCWLSENYNLFILMDVKKIWLLRLFMISVILVLHIVKFHVDSPFASNAFTLNLFSVLACVWIGFEIVYYQNHEPSKILENAGKWSYSLYLVHPFVEGLLFYVGFKNSGKLSLVLLSLVLSYIFYLIIEKPSHRFSVWFSKKVSQKSN